MRTIEELKAEAEKIEDSIFFLKMKDRWSSADYEQSRQYNNRLREIREEIENR